MQRKVADSNFLRSPKLRDYLKASRTNFVVVTPFVELECSRAMPRSLFSSRRKFSQATRNRLDGLSGTSNWRSPGLVQGDVIGLVALDFILRIIRRSTVNIAFIFDGSLMHFDDFSAHTSSFRIPAHVIANLERLGHCSVLVRSWSAPYSKATYDAKSTSVYNIDHSFCVSCLLAAATHSA